MVKLTLEFLEWVKAEYGYRKIDEIIEEFSEIVQNYENQFPAQPPSTPRYVQCAAINKSEPSEPLVLVKYKECFVVVGDSVDLKDRFKAFGCKWLTMKDDPENRKGWMFGKSKLEKFTKEFSDLQFTCE